MKSLNCITSEEQETTQEKLLNSCIDCACTCIRYFKLLLQHKEWDTLKEIKWNSYRLQLYINDIKCLLEDNYHKLETIIDNTLFLSPIVKFGMNDYTPFIYDSPMLCMGIKVQQDGLIVIDGGDTCSPALHISTIIDLLDSSKKQIPVLLPASELEYPSRSNRQEYWYELSVKL